MSAFFGGWRPETASERKLSVDVDDADGLRVLAARVGRLRRSAEGREDALACRIARNVEEVRVRERGSEELAKREPHTAGDARLVEVGERDLERLVRDRVRV